jgi:electron transport complex protein RnfC
MKTFKIGGIHPHANKITDSVPITDIAVPAALSIGLAESIGKPSKPIVKAGQEVKAFEKIAEGDGFVSATLHAPVAGKIKGIEKVRNPQGYWTDAIVLIPNADADNTLPAPRSEEEVRQMQPEKIVDLIGEGGIVGLGGATFPTRVKLTPPSGATPKIVIINGAECEPYLTCDDLLMQTEPRGVAMGAHLIMRAVGVDECAIGIEENKPKAIAAMRKAVEEFPGMRVEVLKKKYPQGGEKEMISAIMGVDVPGGALPVSVGAIVNNVATAFAVYEMICLCRPLTHRIVTVTGPGLKNPGNFRTPLGTPISSLIEAAGGFPEDTGKVIAGGPMMGRAVSDLSSPSTKGLSGLLLLPRSMSERGKEENCIRCATCVHACPMGLEPYLLIAQARNQRWEDMKTHLAMNCIECGSCAYVCPSHKPLLDFIKLGKQEIRKLK